MSKVDVDQDLFIVHYGTGYRYRSYLSMFSVSPELLIVYIPTVIITKALKIWEVHIDELMVSNISLRKAQYFQVTCMMCSVA